MPYLGVIIEESLKDKNILKDVKVLSTKIEEAGAEEGTPNLAHWTMHTVEIPEGEEEAIAQKLSQSLYANNNGHWYADYKNATHHYIIFPGKIFYIDRAKKEEYDEATKYGISVGVPAHQLGFSLEVI
ncbi:MAG: hypothetical protein V1684_01290 [bacterium]